MTDRKQKDPTSAKQIEARAEINHRWAGRALSVAKVAGSALRLAARKVIGAHSETDAHIGASLAHELDQMKGLAMKVGQILSYFDGVMPASVHEALRALQRGAQPIAFEAIQQVIEAAFEQPLASLFDAIEPQPVAAASIGQVHRAQYRGQPVALKVQYPHVQTTFESDFRRIGRLASLASAFTAVDGDALVAELRARIVDECDYMQEATHQDHFRAAFAHVPEVYIPDVFWERTRKTVLTTAWAEGEDFYSFVDHADTARRREAALILTHFAFHSIFKLGFLNVDPHPGNYLFPAESGVVFLDFGCVCRIPTGEIDVERRVILTVVENRRKDFVDALLATGMIPKPKRFNFDIHWEMLCHQYAAYRQPRFRFTAEHIKAGMEFNGPTNPNLRHLAIPPRWIWLQRLQWGLHAVLARLDVDAPFADVMRAALA